MIQIKQIWVLNKRRRGMRSSLYIWCRGKGTCLRVKTSLTHNLAGPHSAVYIVQVICSTTSGSQYKYDVGVFCPPSMNKYWSLSGLKFSMAMAEGGDRLGNKLQMKENLSS
jgi:hypothetical protein